MIELIATLAVVGTLTFTDANTGTVEQLRKSFATMEACEDEGRAILVGLEGRLPEGVTVELSCLADPTKTRSA